MTEYWIVFDPASGAVLYRGQGPAGAAAYQAIPAGAQIVVVPAAVVSKPDLDLDALRSDCIAAIDAEAESIRARYITALPGQVGTYLLKANAARRWLADHTASTALLEPEATGRGMTLEALCAEVLQREAAWEAAAGPIERIRLCAKEAVARATTLAAIVAARRVDWSVNASAS